MKNDRYKTTSDKKIIRTAVVDSDGWVEGETWELTAEPKIWRCVADRANFVQFLSRNIKDDDSMSFFTQTALSFDDYENWSLLIRSPNFYPVGVMLKQRGTTWCRDGRSYWMRETSVRGAGFLMTDFERRELECAVNRNDSWHRHVLENIYEDGGIVEITYAAYRDSPRLVIKNAYSTVEVGLWQLQESSVLRDHLLSSLHIEKLRNAIPHHCRPDWLEKAWRWHVRWNVNLNVSK